MGSLDDGCFESFDEVDMGNDLKLEILQSACEDVENEEEETLDEGGVLGVIEAAVRVLLQGLGEDVNRDGLKKTPLRVAKAFCYGTKGYKQDVNNIVHGALFHEAGVDSKVGHAGGLGGLVVVRGLDLFSLCESCLLPFKVCCHVGYIPSGQRVVGLSKLSRVADVFAKRLQHPQRLADEISSALQNSIQPTGVAVMLQCWHILFPDQEECNGYSHVCSSEEMHGWTEVSSLSGTGIFEDEKSVAWRDFSSLLKLKGVNVEKNQKKSSPHQSWCFPGFKEPHLCKQNGGKSFLNPPLMEVNLATNQLNMISAVTSLLHVLGENPSRDGLLGTPVRFIQWLLNFKRSSLEARPNTFGKLNLDWHVNNSFIKNNNLDSNGHHTGDDICSQLNLPFCSQCEHHLLPFQGVVHIGYIPNIDHTGVDRSSFLKVINFYACQLQVQERLTRQIAESVYSVFNRGIIVVVEAKHVCMISRGIEKVGSSTVTIAVLGEFASNSEAKDTFLQTVHRCQAGLDECD